MSLLLLYPKFKAFDSNNNPLSGGKLTTYEPGTVTLKTSYSDYDLSTPNTNPIILNSLGEAEVYLNGGYKLKLDDSNDVNIWTQDNVYGPEVNLTISAFAKTLLDDTTAAAFRSTLGVVIGTDVQAYHAILAALAGLSGATDKLPYFTGASTLDVTSFTAFARTLLDDANAATMLATLGAASLGANSDITSLTGITTPLTIDQGGSGSTGDSIIKGWVQFDGTAVDATVDLTGVADSFNVSSVVDGGTGDYTVNWDTDFANDDYVAVGTCVGLGTGASAVSITSMAVGSVVVRTALGPGNAGAGAFIDASIVNIIAMGDQ